MSTLGIVNEGLSSTKGLGVETAALPPSSTSTTIGMAVVLAVHPPAMFQHAECMECGKRFRSKGAADAHRYKTEHTVVELMAWTVH